MIAAEPELLPDADQVKAMLGYDPAVAKLCEEAYQRGYHKGLGVREPRRSVRQAISGLLELRDALGAASHLDGLISEGRKLPQQVEDEVRVWMTGVNQEVGRLVQLVEQYVPDHQRRPRPRRTA